MGAALDSQIQHGRFLVGSERQQLFPDDSNQSILGIHAGGGIFFHCPRSVDPSVVVCIGGLHVTLENGIPLTPGASFAINLSKIGQLFAIANVDGADLRWLFM